MLGLKKLFSIRGAVDIKNRKVGFTLAEVLITLGIIGVVAAMVISSLVTNYQKKVSVSQLKSSYSLLTEAIKMSEVKNGDFSSWNANKNGNSFFDTYLANYLKYSSKYTSAQLKNLVNRRCLNGTKYTGKTYNNADALHVLLPNGAMLTMNLNSSTENGLWVGIDINGLHAPNVVGKDTFFFYFTPKFGLVPLGGPGTLSTWSYGTHSSRNNIMKGSNSNVCSKKGTGYWCSSLIMMDGWEIRKDYPW